MEWNINFNDFNNVLDDIEECEEFIEEFISNYSTLINNLTYINEGKFFNEIDVKVTEELPFIKEVSKKCTDLRQAVEQYIGDIENADSWINDNFSYKISKDVAESEIDRVKRFFEKDLTTRTRTFDAFLDTISRDIQNYNLVNGGLNIENEYSDNEEIISYLHNRRDEIDSDIRNFRTNSDIIEKIENEIKNLENSLSNLV